MLLDEMIEALQEMKLLFGDREVKVTVDCGEGKMVEPKGVCVVVCSKYNNSSAVLKPHPSSLPVSHSSREFNS